MGQPNVRRPTFLIFLMTMPLVALSATSMIEQKPAKKSPPFPLSLFAQATADDYVGGEQCVTCHEAYAKSFEKSPHALFVRDPKLPPDKQGCEACHGPGRIHMANLEDVDKISDFVIGYTKTKPSVGSQACMRCHSDTMTMSQWHRTEHARADVGCVGCHTIHHGPGQEDPPKNAGKAHETLRSPIFVAAAAPRKLLRADEATMCGKCHRPEVNQFRHNFHHPIPEGRMVCSSCHEVHPTRESAKRSTAQTRVRSASETCVTCHGEMAGPFAFEHDTGAGSAGENCMDCHRPHGSHNPKLLNAFSRGLCNQCHTDKGNDHFPGRSCWAAGCHVGIHGSNTDPLLLRR